MAVLDFIVRQPKTKTEENPPLLMLLHGYGSNENDLFAFAEYLHKKVRIEHWGYHPNEQFSNEALIQEKYCGIRPAPGYPACPDHLEKNTIWDLLDVSNAIGVTLTESLAMWPAASVSGYYFAHPEARYFGLGKMEKDQLIDYSQRRNISLDEAEKWLRPNLNE